MKSFFRRCNITPTIGRLRFQGVKLIYVGDDEGCTTEALEAAINENTAAVAYLIQAEHENGVSLAEATEIARSHNLPLIADAACPKSTRLIISGGMPNRLILSVLVASISTHHIRRVLSVEERIMIETVRQHGFIGPRPVGRGMKVDRQEIIGLVTAIDIWLSTDHDKRLKEQDSRYEALEHELANVDGVSCEVHYPERSHTLSNLHINIDAGITGKDAAEITQALDDGTPRI